MNDAERYMLLYGPYKPPKCRLGDNLNRWTKAETDLLGTDTDPVVARILGKNTATVRTKRERLEIPAFVARWSKAEIALLGTDTDRAVAELLGRSQSSVESQRWHLGIPAYR